jgi:phosphate transport system substrate-binding protein
MNRQRIGLTATLVGASLLAGGCGGGESSREVIVDGSSTVFRISKAAQEAYARVKPDVLVVVNNHGTGGGFGRYLEGEVDLVDASRPAKAAEQQKADAGGIPWTEFHVGYDGITVVVNPKNDFVKSLTVAQLRALWEPGSTIKTWKDLDPTWPDRKITLYCPDNDSGTFEFFTEAIVGTARKQRKDTQASSDDNVLVTGIAGDVDGLGYFGYAYFAANAAKLRAVPIQPEPDAQPVMPNKQTILDKSYHPLARRLYVYVKNQSMARPEVADFVTYYLKNVARLAEAGGYVAPTPDDIAANQQALSKLTGSAGKVASLSLVPGPLALDD